MTQTTEHMIDPVDPTLGAPSIPRKQLILLAQRHRTALIAVLFQLITLICVLGVAFAYMDAAEIPGSTRAGIENALVGMRIAVIGFSIYAVYRLASLIVLQQGSGILFSILMFIPVVSLFALIHLDRKSVRILKRYGATVGLLGASAASLERKFPA